MLVYLWFWNSGEWVYFEFYYSDNAPHTDDPEPDFSIIFKTLNNLTAELRSSFSSEIPILPVLGNHDAYPKVNKFCF